VSAPGAPLALIASAVLDAYGSSELSGLLDVVRTAPLELAQGGDRLRVALSLPPPEDAALARAGRGHSLAELVSLERQYGLPDAGAIERAVFVGLSAGVIWSSAWPRS
jgi:hypothetical protein